MSWSFDRSAEIVLGIDASRNRSGGARAHLIGLLTEGFPIKHGIREIHLWAYQSLLDAVPNQPWLVKHNPAELERSLGSQLWWQFIGLKREVEKAKCDILFSTDASTLCFFKPIVVLSQDMLSYELGVMSHFGYGRSRLRLLAILFLQNWAFRRADGVVFLTRYAAKTIQQSCGQLSRTVHIAHGVGDNFRRIQPYPWPEGGERHFHCLYISNTAMYKHQWVVVLAIERLRKRGHNIVLTLVGGGSGKAQRLLEKHVAKCDREGVFVRQLDFVPQKDLPIHLANADIFVFASSCENMPVTLLEAMAAGLPIACSDRGPMPEVLEDGGVYFNPEDARSIADAIERIITDAELRIRISKRAKELAGQYTWKRCADETFAFIARTVSSLEVSA